MLFKENGEASVHVNRVSHKTNKDNDKEQKPPFVRLRLPNARARVGKANTGFTIIVPDTTVKTVIVSLQR